MQRGAGALASRTSHASASFTATKIIMRPNKYEDHAKGAAAQQAARLHNARRDPSRQEIRARILADAREGQRYDPKRNVYPRRLRRAIARNQAFGKE